MLPTTPSNRIPRLIVPNSGSRFSPKASSSVVSHLSKWYAIHPVALAQNLTFILEFFLLSNSISNPSANPVSSSLTLSSGQQTAVCRQVGGREHTEPESEEKQITSVVSDP